MLLMVLPKLNTARQAAGSEHNCWGLRGAGGAGMAGETATQCLKPSVRVCRLAKGAAEGPKWRGVGRDGSEGGRRTVRAGKTALVKLSPRVAPRERT